MRLTEHDIKYFENHSFPYSTLLPKETDLGRFCVGQIVDTIVWQHRRIRELEGFNGKMTVEQTGEYVADMKPGKRLD